MPSIETPGSAATARLKYCFARSGVTPFAMRSLSSFAWLLAPATAAGAAAGAGAAGGAAECGSRRYQNPPPARRTTTRRIRPSRDVMLSLPLDREQESELAIHTSV